MASTGPLKTALLPLNALGFLALSAVKWNHADPAHIWQFAAAAAAAYLGSTIVRARSGRWKAAVTVNEPGVVPLK